MKFTVSKNSFLITSVVLACGALERIWFHKNCLLKCTHSQIVAQVARVFSTHHWKIQQILPFVSHLFSRIERFLVFAKLLWILSGNKVRTNDRCFLCRILTDIDRDDMLQTVLCCLGVVSSESMQLHLCNYTPPQMALAWNSYLSAPQVYNNVSRIL